MIDAFWCYCCYCIIVRLLTTYHVLETPTDELGLELWAGEATGDFLIGEDIICEVGTGFKGE